MRKVRVARGNVPLTGIFSLAGERGALEYCLELRRITAVNGKSALSDLTVRYLSLGQSAVQGALRAAGFFSQRSSSFSNYLLIQSN